MYRKAVSALLRIIFWGMVMPCICYAQRENSGNAFQQSDSIQTHDGDLLLFHPTIPLGEYHSIPAVLHKGLNGSVELSASFGVGSHHPKGVGFGKNIWLAYAQPIKNKWSYMLSTDINNMKWNGYQWNQASIGGEFNYAASKALSFSIFGYKELVHPNTLMPFHYYNYYSDPYLMNQDSYVGGAVNFKFNDSFFMQISVGTGTLRER